MLEDAIRNPHPFTPDLEEENASMSNIMGGVSGGMGQPAVSHQNGAQMRVVPPASGSNLAAAQTIPASGVRTPRDVLRQREARKKDQEAKEQQIQQHKQEQARYQQQAAQPAQPAQLPQPQQQYSADVPGDPSRRPGVNMSRPPDMPLPRDPASKLHTRGGSVPRIATAQTAPRTQAPRPRASTATAPAQPQAATQPEAPSQEQQSKRPNFPHAFERWEMLSSHWEGLTGYWMRRLEQNKDELSGDPISQQISRQVTDLSAAGANLFHAVVELQRLRASSERKFQRWFFDTRAEQERNQELRAELERQLKAERQTRTESMAASKQAESDKLKAEELVREMRRELLISKEEARRAWEELGRREQEERERTVALRNGEPTSVGGVQVVPMVPGMSSRQASTANRPPTREGPYAGGPGPMRMGGQDPAEEEQYQYEEESITPTSAHPQPHPFVQTPRGQEDPFAGATPGKETGTSAQTTPSAAAQQSGESPPSNRFYQHDAQLHGVDTRPEADDGSYVQSVEGGSSDIGAEEYTPGRRADRTVYPLSISEDSDDYGDEHDEYGRRHHPHPYGEMHYGNVSAAEDVHSGYGPPNVDYSGSGWGNWDSVTPRHRHPTRLSDVLEEDERSRTSASRASQASRTIQ